MKNYKITVNGNAYDVTVEETAGGAVSAGSAPPAPAAKPAPASAPASAPVAAAGEGAKVEAPMPGTIIDVKLAVGASVKRGQAVAVLEAMKMENDIVSPADGVITSIAVTKGQSVNTGSLIATVK
ncbi:acetyl-CoA carboxylase biotin carboxyl carrier protein subunit [Clostridia bacterium]|nr:acetyl-CoA carboxylase biotin carboxyl carrier protein subunit [Clostridia bacterium]GHU57519.1 acetyl-CoA carboxylase biotin carboxyl carrier protein subunit [Clostridia bacterium]